ncbi:MAG: HAD family hydrolase [Candidatus Hodarchaeales archaeon]|jgi:FMN phosphatase YigB (HAD superfamily)
MSRFHELRKPQVVFFTLLGTICYTRPSVITKFFEILRTAGLNIARSQVRTSFHKAESWIYSRKNAGWPLTGLETERYKRVFFSSLGVTGELTDYYDQILSSTLEKSRFWTTSLTLSKDVTPLLINLAEQEIKCGLIVNSDLQGSKILRKLGIRRYFQEIFSSGSVGVGLPNPKILRAALAFFKVRPSRGFFIGSRPIVEGEGAKAANLPYVLVKGKADDMFEQPKESFLGYNTVESYSEVMSYLE